MLQSIYVDPDDLRKAKVLASREEMTPTAIIRGLIQQGIKLYEQRYGAIPIDGVTPHFKPRRSKNANSIDLCSDTHTL